VRDAHCSNRILPNPGFFSIVQPSFSLPAPLAKQDPEQRIANSQPGLNHDREVAYR